MSVFNTLKIFYCSILLITYLTAATNAQQYIGVDNQPSIIVDHSVIDNLGQSPNIPQILLNSFDNAFVSRNPGSSLQPRFPAILNGQSSVNLRPTSSKPFKNSLKSSMTKKKSARISISKLTPTKLKPSHSNTKSRQVRILAPPNALKRQKSISAPKLPRLSKLRNETKPQTVASPPALKSGATLRILFNAGSAELDKGATRVLEKVYSSLSKNPNLRIQLRAYANSAGGSASKARHLSLLRALRSRSYLIKKGIEGTRIPVRALGDKFGAGAADRVDIDLIN